MAAAASSSEEDTMSVPAILQLAHDTALATLRMQRIESNDHVTLSNIGAAYRDHVTLSNIGAAYRESYEPVLTVHQAKLLARFPPNTGIQPDDALNQMAYVGFFFGPCEVARWSTAFLFPTGVDAFMRYLMTNVSLSLLAATTARFKARYTAGSQCPTRWEHFVKAELVQRRQRMVYEESNIAGMLEAMRFNDDTGVMRGANLPRALQHEIGSYLSTQIGQHVSKHVATRPLITAAQAAQRATAIAAQLARGEHKAATVALRRLAAELEHTAEESASSKRAKQ